MEPPARPGGTLPQYTAQHRFRDVSTTDVIRELLGRFDSLPPELGGELEVLLERACDHHQNRFGVARLRGHFQRFHHCNGQRIDVRGRTVVDLGCGAKNPLALLMIDVLLGARRGIGIDLDTPHAALATAGMVRAAGYLLLDPHLIVGDWPITREEVARNVGSLDLQRLLRGDVHGLDEERLAFRQESAVPTSLATGEVDLLYSNSFLEHVAAPDDVVAELARVTGRDGLGVHYIDGTDHRRYVDSSAGAFDFLCVESQDELVRGCNRLRPLQFVDLFARHGFEVVEVTTWPGPVVTPDERARFVEPFRSMSAAWLGTAEAVIRVRRR